MAAAGLRRHEKSRTHDSGRSVKPTAAKYPVSPLAMSVPLVYSRITSPYGWRVHPVLGTWRFHKGVDYGAPEGTPVHASAAGAVVSLGRRGNYGNYIRLRHSGHLQTAYAHLAAFAPGLEPGSFVRRGQLIGYVGKSGLATGPHLYFEVILNGRHLDPNRVTLSRLQSADSQWTSGDHAGRMHAHHIL